MFGTELLDNFTVKLSKLVILGSVLALAYQFWKHKTFLRLPVLK